MINFFRNPFHKEDNPPTKTQESDVKEKSGLKVKVEPFDSDCTRYIIKYKIPGRLNWNRYETTMLYGSENICSADHPVMFKTFESACEKSKTFTIKKLEEHESEVFATYHNHIQKLRKGVSERNKSAEFEL